LSGVEDGSFDNILCETVIMHLRDAAVSASVTRLLSILRPGGMLYLSWRVNSDDVLRDKHGRLYANWDAELVLAPLRNTSVLIDEETVSASS
ncbi:class I SAM-dependent methyltransferase, partial [Acinetobacter baumannii]